jgi:bacillithiol system protein YtxJ
VDAELSPAAPRAVNANLCYAIGMNTIDTQQEWGALVQESSERPVLVFKHSNACPISARAHEEVRKLVESGGEAAPYGFGMIVVQAARSLSNAVEESLGVRHETPQALVIRDGKVVWHASHFDITRDRLAEALGAS